MTILANPALVNTNRKTATIVGILILVAYSMLASVVTDTKWVVALLDLISGLAVIGIAVLMFPLFKTSNKQLSLGYLYLKILGGLLTISAGMFFLSDSFKGWREWIYNYPQTYEFIISGSLFYVLLFRTKLVPRFISVWGLVACFTLLMANVAKSLGVNSAVLDVLMVPIFANEIFIAVWLITKGFNRTVIN